CARRAGTRDYFDYW
nr:immunoglobulin heavy chain junction region [Mus musculus]